MEQIEKEKNPEKFLEDYRAMKSMMVDLCDLIKCCGYSTVVVFFDKIDEYVKLNSSMSSVANFLNNFLRDTTILMNKSYSLVFSLWDVLKPELTNRGVRFDKIKPIDITWQNENLKEILEKRISYFSNGQKTISQIIESEDLLNNILNLSNCSPRYLFRELSYIYDQQAEINNMSSVLTKNAIVKGQLTFAKNFDYYSIYPSKRGAKEDILTNINRILKIGKEVIKTKDFSFVFKVSVPTAISYIKIMQEYDLIKELTETDGGAKMYEIKDPIIKFLIQNNVSELKK